MRRLHHIICLLLCLTGCSKVHKVGMCSVKDLIGKSLPSEQPDVNQTFTASDGRSVSFAQENGTWVAMVDKDLKLPVFFQEGFSIEGLATCSSEKPSNLIHIMQPRGR